MKNWHCEEFKKLRVPGYNTGSHWYQRNGHFFMVSHDRFMSTTLRCAVKLCPARWNQKKNQFILGPVNPDHNHQPHKWMRDRNIMFNIMKRRIAEEDTNITLIYEEEAAKYPDAAKHMPFRTIKWALRSWRKRVKPSNGNSPVVVPDVAHVIGLDDDNQVDTPEPLQRTTDPAFVPKFKVQTSNFLTTIPQLQNPLCSTNSFLVPVQTSSLMTTIPQLFNPVCPTNTTLVPRFHVRTSGIITAIPQLLKPLCSTNPNLSLGQHRSSAIVGQQGPTIEELPQLSLGHQGPTIDGLPQLSLGQQGPTIETLPQLTLGQQEPTIATLPQLTLGQQGPTIETLPQLTLGQQGLTIEGLPQLSLGQQGPTIEGLPQLKVRADLMTEVPQLQNPLSPKPAQGPCLKIRRSEIVTGIPQLQDLLTPKPAQGPGLKIRRSEIVTGIPQLQDPLKPKPALEPDFVVQFELLDDDPEPDPLSEETLYQLFDDPLSSAPAPVPTPTPLPTPTPTTAKPQTPLMIRIVKCRACYKDVPWYVFIPCGHVICRKCYDLRIRYRHMCYVCCTTIDHPLRMLF